MNIEKQHTEADQSKAPRPQDVPVRRDPYGHWWHPAIDWDRIPEDEVADPHLENMGFDASYVRMEDDAPAMADAYLEDGDADFSAWNPSRPDGENWFLGAIYDTEGGPAACWLKPIRNATTMEI
jgi:hypothetical protein